MTEKAQPGWALETLLWTRGYSPVAGVDEAGRGALAGPVVAAAVVLPYEPDYPFRDSKTLLAAQRERLAEEVETVALAWAVGAASAAEVDALNVLRATHLAAARALAVLTSEFDTEPQALVTDFLKLTFGTPPKPTIAVPRGESRSYGVAAASLLAKVARDALMRDLEEEFSGYGFAKHKGYGSPEHLRALQKLGPSPVHRLSFRPVARARAEQSSTG